MPKLGIIVPCYNAEKYIVELINILDHQTNNDFRVIFVEDFSDDNTQEVLKRALESVSFDYALLLNSSNIGAAMSRNKAIECADSDYITFIDSDDLITEHFVDEILTAFKEHLADAVFFDSCMVSEKGKMPLKMLPGSSYGVISLEQAFLHSLGSSWGKAYKLSIIKDNNIKFPNIYTKEDFVFNKSAIIYCKDFFYINKKLYLYRNNADSIMHNLNETEQFTETNRYKAFQILIKDIDPRYKELVLALSVKELLWNSIQTLIREKKSIRSIESLIYEYELFNKNWREQIVKYKFGGFERYALFLLGRNKWKVLYGLVKAKDTIKQICLG